LLAFFQKSQQKKKIGFCAPFLFEDEKTSFFTKVRIFSRKTFELLLIFRNFFRYMLKPSRNQKKGEKGMKEENAIFAQKSFV
jgi:hypothetical protein